MEVGKEANGSTNGSPHDPAGRTLNLESSEGEKNGLDGTLPPSEKEGGEGWLGSTAGIESRAWSRAQEGGSIHHYALIYESREEQFEAVVPFIEQGLAKGERCLYVMDENTEEEVLAALREGGVDADAALEAGALSIHTADMYLRDGEFDPEWMLEFWRKALAEAKGEKGYTGLRAAAETSWALKEETSLDQLIEYELMLNPLLSGEDYAALCQYNRERFPDAFLSKVIRTHPNLIIDQTPCRNVYFTPREEFFGEDRPSDEVDRMIGAVREGAWVKTALQKRTEDLWKFTRLTSHAELSFTEKLAGILDLGRKHFGLEVGFLTRKEGAEFRIVAASGAPEGVEPGVTVVDPLPDQFCRKTLALDRPIGVEDVEEEGWDDDPLYRKYELGCYLGVKVTVGDSVYGTLSFANQEARSRSFTGAERAFLDLMGQWVSYELESRKSRKALRKSKARLESKVVDMERLHALSIHLLDENDTKSALHQALVASAELLGAEKASVQTYDEEDEVLRLVSVLGFDQDFFDQFQVVDPDGVTPYAASLQQREHILVEDLSSSPKFETFARVAGPYDVEAALSAPLFGSDDQLFGVFTMYWDRPHRPAEEKLRLLDLHLQQAARQIERKRAEERLRALNETLEERVEERTRQVRELTSQVVRAEQRERKRVGRLLHDDLQQQLYGSQLHIQSLHDSLLEKGEGRLAGETKEAAGQIKEVLQSLRRLSVGLSPPILKEEGLVAALEWLQSQMEETRGIEMTLQAEQEFRVGEEMRVLLFQTTRELLSNAYKHSGVEEASIDLFEEDGELVLEISDEREGFNPGQVKAQVSKEGLGLTAARERLRLFGGELTVRSAPGEGTHATIRLPLKRSSEPSLLAVSDSSVEETPVEEGPTEEKMGNGPRIDRSEVNS